MALLSALVSLLSKQLSTVLQAVFGWAITGLFGRLPAAKQTAIAVALLLSLAWPLLLVGAFAPGVASWAIALVPLHDLIGATATRVLWLALALLAPLVVGALTAWAVPDKNRKASFPLVVLSGFPIAVGFLISFLITLFVVPALKIAAMARGWVDEHVYVLVGPGAYEEVLSAIRRACGDSGLLLEEEPVPAPMQLAARALIFFARGVVAPLVPNTPRRLRGEQLELHLYSGDLLIRGKPPLVAKVRAAILVRLVKAPAHLTSDPAAQRFEDEVKRGWEMVERHGRGHVGVLGRGRVREMARELDRLGIPFEDWVLLYTNLQMLERAVAGGPDLVDDVAPAKENVMDSNSKAASAHPDGIEMVREAIADGKALVLLELELAKAEAENELDRVKLSGAALAVALALAGAGVALLVVAIVLAVHAKSWPP